MLFNPIRFASQSETTPHPNIIFRLTGLLYSIHPTLRHPFADKALQSKNLEWFYSPPTITHAIKDQKGWKENTSGACLFNEKSLPFRFTPNFIRSGEIVSLLSTLQSASPSKLLWVPLFAPFSTSSMRIEITAKALFNIFSKQRPPITIAWVHFKNQTAACFGTLLISCQLCRSISSQWKAFEVFFFMGFRLTPAGRWLVALGIFSDMRKVFLRWPAMGKRFLMKIWLLRHQSAWNQLFSVDCARRVGWSYRWRRPNVNDFLSSKFSYRTIWTRKVKCQALLNFDMLAQSTWLHHINNYAWTPCYFSRQANVDATINSVAESKLITNRWGEKIFTLLISKCIWFDNV